MSDSQIRPFKGFETPMHIVDRTEMSYEERLALLQDWTAHLASSGSGEVQQEAVQGAIHALEMGSEIQDDAPEAAPAHGYGKPLP